MIAGLRIEIALSWCYAGSLSSNNNNTGFKFSLKPIDFLTNYLVQKLLIRFKNVIKFKPVMRNLI